VSRHRETTASFSPHCIVECSALDVNADYGLHGHLIALGSLRRTRNDDTVLPMRDTSFRLIIAPGNIETTKANQMPHRVAAENR